jgi:hypothetical protein
MNERERFHRVLRGETVDRPPLLDEGVRDEVIDRWHREGLPKGKTHLEVFGITPHENIGPDIRFRKEFFGRVMQLSTRVYQQAFDVSRSRFPEDWDETVRRLENRDHIVCIWASRGFFQALGVGDWSTLHAALLGTVREARRVREKAELYGAFCARMLEMTLSRVDPDFIYLSEPISDNKGSLISPEMFQEFMIPAYERILAVARAHGVEQITVSTYGNTAELVPSLIKAGVNSLWISEAAETPETDYRTLRKRHGPGLGLIGGIPLSILREEAEANMEQRIREMVQPLSESGRYIPLAGGRIREEIPWKVYKRYREILADVL